MKKTILALTLSTVFSGAAFAESANLNGFGDGARLTHSYNKVAEKISEIDPNLGEKFTRYVTGGADSREERREIAFELVRDAHESGNGEAIREALKNVFVKHDGNPVYADKAMSASNSLIADAAAYARDNNMDVGLSNSELNKIVTDNYKWDGQDIEKAIEANHKAVKELEKYQEENDPARIISKEVDARIAKSSDKLYAAGDREVTKLETALTSVNDSIRADGAAAVKASEGKLYAAGSREVAKMETALTSVNDSIRADGAAAVKASEGKLYAAGGREVAKMETALTSVNDSIRADGAAAVKASEGKLYAAGSREVAKMETALTSVNDSIRADGAAAVTASEGKLYAAGGREVAKMETALTSVNASIRADGADQVAALQAQIDQLKASENNGTNDISEDRIRLDDVIANSKTAYKELKHDSEYNRSQADLAHRRITATDENVEYNRSQADLAHRRITTNEENVAYTRSQADLAHRRVTDLEQNGIAAGQAAYDKLNAAGSREVAKMETALTSVNDSIRTDGQTAYNKLRAEGGREVAKLESVADSLNKKIDSMEGDGIEYVQAKADEAVKKSSAKLREDGGREVAKLETALTSVNTAIRADGQKAYNSIQAQGGREVAKLETSLTSVNDAIRSDGADQVAALQAQIDTLKAKIDEAGNNSGSKDAVISEEVNRRIASAKAEGQAAIDALRKEISENGGSNNSEISKEVDKRIAEAAEKIEREAGTVEKEAGKQAALASTTLSNHENRIGSLEQSMEAMGNRMLAVEERMDGVVASAHAISNARPVLSSAGQYGVGVGIGGAGSKKALALGGAMQFTENWSGSMSVNYETKGKVSSHQFSAGVGAQYVF
ncbi:YadA-like family protein [Vibrio hannami]|uniref:YadA-like family protein n=1 Tax=Vibrio hannami TaxID=2717094 RepID=UPI0024106805|nr:YadA-like family protein [Vibrio hannami]MDG3086494.1 YadA-like family protein [Vibrio hannami]